MKEIVIVSGKGGVGKTTVSASLALLFHKKGSTIVTADYDVDAPNLALVLEGKEMNRESVSAAEIAVIDPEKCIGCGQCVEVCKFDAVEETEPNTVAKIHDMFCEGCGACTIVCPTDAISLHQVESGVIRTIHSKYGFPLVVGQLNIGKTASGKIVVETRKRVRELGEEINADFIVVDGPPGVGCPAIATISNADYVILVTEPTPAAKHDLERIFTTVSHFGHPSGLILNNADLYEPVRTELLEFVETFNIDLLGEIPVDNSIPISIANAVPVVEDQPNSPASNALTNIENNLRMCIA
ncbi:MAG: ATP-binding protein [Candidatus Hodarchaeota archaeon]